MCLVVARLALALLLLKAQALVHGIVELGKGIGKLAPGDEKLVAVRYFRPRVVAARERRDGRGIMIDEVRLDELVFHIQVKELGLELFQALVFEDLFAPRADIAVSYTPLTLPTILRG